MQCSSTWVLRQHRKNDTLTHLQKMCGARHGAGSCRQRSTLSGRLGCQRRRGPFCSGRWWLRQLAACMAIYSSNGSVMTVQILLAERVPTKYVQLAATPADNRWWWTTCRPGVDCQSDAAAPRPQRQATRTRPGDQGHVSGEDGRRTPRLDTAEQTSARSLCPRRPRQPAAKPPADPLRIAEQTPLQTDAMHESR